MDNLEFIFEQFGCEESTQVNVEVKKDKLTKKEKKHLKEVKYEESKQESKQRQNKKRKNKLIGELAQFQTHGEKIEYLGCKRKAKEYLKQRGLAALQSKLRVVIDCSFADLMEERENRSLST